MREDRDGMSAFMALAGVTGEIPNTRGARTPSGGFHLLLWSPAEIRNGKAAPGFDVRGTGGYLVAPPSKRRPNANGCASRPRQG